ncbi:hypothetical protein K1719_030047 [Acacia pycnantha]|nr:hypothetical protein K1719_030047 [Acacia pycnantha]
MHTHSRILFSYAFSNLFFFLLLTVPQYQSRPDDGDYLRCSQNYNCGNLLLPHPFWGGKKPDICGVSQFEVTCLASEISIQVGSQTFTLKDIDPSRSMVKMVRTDIPSYDNCSFNFTGTWLDPTLFSLDYSVVNMTLFYDCVPGFSIGRNNITCSDDSQKQAFFVTQTELEQFPGLSQNCRVQIQVPVTSDFTADPFGGIESLKDALDRGFDAQYDGESRKCTKCMESGGVCGSTYGFHHQYFCCFCRDGETYDLECPVLASMASASGFAWGGIIGTLLISIAIICCKLKSLSQKIRFWKTSKGDRQIEAFIKNQEPFPITRYRFADIKKITKSFQVKLGEGGYGTVYKGKLLNGCPVAVKTLNPSKGNGEEFINEVASISKTSHVNIVTLLGFCLEGEKKALVYEFMCNGSLDKLIYNKENKTNSSLTWENLYKIVIGTARGLEYLHKGCNTRILHFDIKPHNILLDESFCPKISDFGLAKLCPSKKSIISLLETRGTLGYLAPEVWNRNIGGVSYKCDVYSYGVMLLDIVGALKDVTVESNYPIENYVLDSIYEKLEQGNDLGRNGMNTIEERDIARKITIVGMWCMQTFPTQRPTMSKVIEMLEGSLDSLQIPPRKPIMSSIQEES